MLRSEHKHTALEDIVQELLTTSNRPTTRLLAEFVQRYPDFANEILSFASEWALQESMGESELAHEIDEKLIQAKAHSALKDALFRFDRNSASETGHDEEPVVGKTDDLKARSTSTKPRDNNNQPATIFILGADAEHCKELSRILERHVVADIITANSGTIGITSEEKNTGVLYRHLLNKLEDQIHRAELFGQLIRLFSSSLKTDELLERVVSKSTEVLGDTSLVVLSGESGQLSLEAVFSTDRDRLVKMLVTAVNLGEQATKSLVSAVLVRREPVLISNLPQASLTPEIRSIVQKHGIISLLAVPIQTKEAVLGALVSLASE